MSTVYLRDLYDSVSWRHFNEQGAEGDLYVKLQMHIGEFLEFYFGKETFYIFPDMLNNVIDWLSSNYNDEIITKLLEVNYGLVYVEPVPEPPVEE